MHAHMSRSVLSSNNISSIDNVTFPNQLVNLSLSSNFIGNSAVHLNESESLKTLNLSYNRISRLANMTLPSTLEILNMSGNALKDDLVFPPTPSLEVLYV
ncbi:hypothetical protein DYB26_002880, partial [Aphanomyces astaci]